MASKLEVYQQALTLVGAKTLISSINEENNPNLIHCNTWEPTARGSLLRMYPWKWATVHSILRSDGNDPRYSELNTDSSIYNKNMAWDYRYPYESDWIKVIRLENGAPPNSSLPPFIVAGYFNSFGQYAGRAIFTSAEPDTVQAVVTLDAGNRDSGAGGTPSYLDMPDHFSGILAIKLASLIAYPITGKYDLARNLNDMYEARKLEFVRQDDLVKSEGWLADMGDASMRQGNQEEGRDPR